MGKKSKRSAEEAGLVTVVPEGVTAAAVGEPAADVADASTADVTMEKPKKKKSKKDKSSKEGKTKEDKEDKEKDSALDLLEIPADALSPIAHPLAGKKLGKKTLKTVKKAARARQVKRGVKEVVKSLRKGEKGLVVMAADISPMDILTHIPLLAEECSCPYVFVTSKELLGQASSTKRPTSCVMICPDAKKKAKKPKADGKEAKEPEDYKESYAEIVKEIEELDAKITY